jgi:chorismate synthase
MSFNSTGKIFTVTSFGESHGEAVGAIIDGCPANIELDMEAIQHQLNRRRPGQPAQSATSTSRNEADKVKILSGVFEGKTTGSPITLIIENQDARSEDYDQVKNFYRPSHADFVYDKKYGHYDYRGGGRSSARTMAPVVAAGAIAMQLLGRYNISVKSFVRSAGEIEEKKSYAALDLQSIDSNEMRTPDSATASRMLEYINGIRKSGDTVGGVIECVISGVPVGLGEPVFEKLNANIAKAMFSINAVKGIQFGEGFKGATSLGSMQNDMFEKSGDSWHTRTNHSGGIQGGISNGMDIWFDLAFKPVSTLMQPQETAMRSGEKGILEPAGRHDACVLPRAVPIVDAYASLVILDHLLIYLASRNFNSGMSTFAAKTREKQH